MGNSVTYRVKCPGVITSLVSMEFDTMEQAEAYVRHKLKTDPDVPYTVEHVHSVNITDIIMRRIYGD